MPKLCNMRNRHFHQTIPKSVDAERYRNTHASESSQSDISNSCSVLSGSRSELSIRTGSDVPLQSAPCLPPRNRSVDSCLTHEHQNRLQPLQLPLPPHRHSSRTRRSVSHTRSRHRRTSRPSPFLQRRFLIIITIISVTFSVLACGFATLCFVYKLMPSLDEHTFKEGDLNICVPCVLLDDDTGINSALTNQLNSLSNSDDCCARTTGEWSVLLEIIKNRQKNITDDESICQDKLCHIKFKANDSDRQHNRSILVRDNSLHVKISGCYFIYSSINMKPRSEVPCRQLPNQTFRHYIWRFRPLSPSHTDSLAETAHVCCDDCTEDHHTSYAGGVFKLKADDQIFIKVRGSGKVLFNDDGSYLGLVLLDSSTVCSDTDGQQHSML